MGPHADSEPVTITHASLTPSMHEGLPLFEVRLDDGN